LPLFIAGLFRDRGLAGRVISALLDAGVPSGDISLAARERAEEDVTARDELDVEDDDFGALAIHSAWERLGWQGGARPAYRDKVAPKIDFAFVAAGPLAIAIGGAQLGAAAGGIVGSMTNFGYLHETAREWYGRLIEGRAWVMVRTTEEQAERVRKIFEKYRADLGAESLRHW
jgi:hypothetical protein